MFFEKYNQVLSKNININEINIFDELLNNNMLSLRISTTENVYIKFELCELKLSLIKVFDDNKILAQKHGVTLNMDISKDIPKTIRIDVFIFDRVLNLLLKSLIKNKKAIPLNNEHKEHEITIIMQCTRENKSMMEIIMNSSCS